LVFISAHDIKHQTREIANENCKKTRLPPRRARIRRSGGARDNLSAGGRERAASKRMPAGKRGKTLDCAKFIANVLAMQRARAALSILLLSGSGL
jgi:hypothetical protein